MAWQCFKLSKGLRSQRGSVISSVVALGGATVIIIGAVIVLGPKIQKRAKVSGDFLRLKMALHSSLDYTATAIRSRWCMTNSWSRDGSCDLTHPANIERMTMLQETVNYITSTPSIPRATPIKLGDICRVVRMPDFEPGHPLTMVFDTFLAKLPAQVRTESRLRFQIINDPPPDGSITAPNAAYLRMRVDWFQAQQNAAGVYSANYSNDCHLPASGRQNSSIFGEALVLVAPRQLNTMALLLAKDLHLGNTGVTFPSGSSTSISDFPLAAPPATQPEPGLTFHSGVFVNGSVHVPASTVTDRYVPVTFGGPLIIGGGTLRQDGSPRADVPQDAVLAMEEKGFGGALKGIRLDPYGEDLGLTTFADASAPPSSHTMWQQCSLLNTLKNYDLTITKRSALMVRGATPPIPAPGTAYSRTLNFAFSGRNFFQSLGRQNTVTVAVGSGAFLPGRAPAVTNTPSVDPEYQRSFLRIRVRMRTQANQYIPIPTTTTTTTTTSTSTTSTTTTTTLAPVPITPPPKNFDMEAYLGVNSALQFTPDISPGGGANPEVRIELKGVQLGANTKDQPHMMKLEVSVSDTANVEGLVIEPYFFDPGWKLNTNSGIPYYDRSPGQDTAVVSSSTMQSGGNILIFRQNLQAGPGLPPPFTSPPPGPPSPPPSALVLDTTDPVNWTFALRAFDGNTNFTVLPEDLTRDEQKLEEDCQTPPPPADWDQSYASQVRHSWCISWLAKGPDAAEDSCAYPNSMTPNMDHPSSITLNSNTTQNQRVQTVSIANTVTIGAGANRIVGLFMADRFEIAARAPINGPLNIYGTVITKELVIHPSALQSQRGIHWYSLTHPQATLDLRGPNAATAILRRTVGPPPPVGCPPIPVPQRPIWHPQRSVDLAKEIFDCSATALVQAQNFRWTQVDPDRFLPTPTSTDMVSKGRAMRLSVSEIYRTLQIPMEF